MRETTCLDLVDLCYRSVETPALWQRFVEDLTNAMGADAGDFTIEDYRGGVASPLGTVGFDPGLRIDYDVDFLGANPWIEGLRPLPRRRAFSNALEPEDFEMSGFYNEWVRPQGFRHAIGAIVEETDARIVHIGVLRDRERQPFDGAAGRLMDAVLPHIHRALRLAELVATATSETGPLALLVGQLGMPAFLIGSDGRVLEFNEPAETVLRQGRSLALKHGRLVHWHSESALRLEEAIACACRLETMPAAQARLQVALGPVGVLAAPLVAEVVPLRGNAAQVAVGPHCLVLLVDPHTRRTASPGLLAQIWDLTPSEARLASALAEARSLADFAAGASMSVGTARWHLKNLQAKTGTHSLAELVLLVQGVGLPI